MKSSWIAAILIGSLALVVFAQDAEKKDSPPGGAAPKPEAGAKTEKAEEKPSEKPDEKTDEKTAKKAELKSLQDKASYAIGVNIGRSLKAQGFEADLSLVLLGMEDVLQGGKCLLSDPEINHALTESRKELAAKRAERMKGAADKNLKEGVAFLEANRQKPGVVTLPSGLQYKVVQEGTGPKPAATDKVTTHYRGRLIDGKEFDSSYSRGEPTSFPVNGVIKGWTEALQLMPVGSKWELYIPAELAYGASGAGNDIGPNAALVFEIELLGIESK